MSIYIVRTKNGGVVESARPKIDSLTLDASISENHNYSSMVPEFTVETGSTISDNVVNLPAELEIRGTVSVLGGDPSRADDAFKTLLDIRDNREPITVVTTAKTYSNMMLKKLNVPRDKSNNGALVFTASFKEVIFADASVVTVDKIKPVQKAEKKAAPKKEEPEQITEDILLTDEQVFAINNPITSNFRPPS